MGKIAGDSKSALFRQRGLGTKEIAILGKLQIEKDREFAENENELKKRPRKIQCATQHGRRSTLPKRNSSLLQIFQQYLQNISSFDFKDKL